MKNYGILLLLLILLGGCSASGKRTYYREHRTGTMIKNIGVVNITADSANTKLCPTIETLSDSVIRNVLLEKKDFTYKYFDRNTNFANEKENDSISIEQRITEFCRNNNLDGILFVHLKFIDAKYTVALIPVLKECHAESAMLLYGKDGKKLLSTGYNTLQGDSYFSSPGPEIRARDAIQIGLNWTMYETAKLNKRSGY